jgi:hypothetical protein
MPPDDWVTRHPELVHWLQHAEDELVGYAPLDDIPLPTAVFPERLLPFFVVLSPPMGPHGVPRHQWASMDCLYSQADIATLRTFFTQVHGPQDPFLFHDCICHFANECLLVRPLTTVASRLDPVRIVSLTYEPRSSLRLLPARRRRRSVCVFLRTTPERSLNKEDASGTRPSALRRASPQTRQGSASWLRQQP